MKKRIVWHLPYAMIGGVETLYATILKYIDSDKYEHFITCHTQIQQWVKDKFRRKAIVRTFINESSLAMELKSIDPHLIMGTHGRSLYESLSMLDKKYPVVEIVHGSHIWSEHNVYMPKDWTQHVICVSNSAERIFRENTPVEKDTSVIINGIDTELFFPAKPLQKQSKSIGYLGRFLESDKHIKKIIKAFKSLGDYKARLYLIGGTPQEVVHLKHFARSLKMSTLVKISPHTSTPEKFYRNLDVFTVRSEAEGYCNSAAEALATGTPCVCYNFGGILEHVPRGTIAVANTQQEYAKLLAEVHRNYDLRKKMRQMGIDFIQKEGNAKTMVRRYEHLIDAVLGKKSISIPKPVEKKVPVKNINIEGTPSSVQHERPVVGLCNLSWHGIHTATKNVCDDVVGWHKDPQMMVKKIIKKNPRAVLFSGMCPGFDKVAYLLHRQHPKFPLYVYYHGGLSHYSFRSGIFGAGESAAFQKILMLHKEGVFRKIAVSYPGLAETLRDSGYDAHFCGNIMPKNPIPEARPLNGFHIGAWNRHLDHKHTSISIAVANLARATLHCLNGYPEIPGIHPKDIRTYSDMPQAALYEKYTQMTVNLQMSFIETFNISVLEMWSVGAPVLLGSGNYVLVKDNPLLEKMCYVKDQTNPLAIAKQAEKIKFNRQQVVDAQYKQLDALNKEVSSRWEQFFG